MLGWLHPDNHASQSRDVRQTHRLEHHRKAQKDTKDVERLDRLPRHDNPDKLGRFEGPVPPNPSSRAHPSLHASTTITKAPTPEDLQTILYTAEEMRTFE